MKILFVVDMQKDFIDGSLGTNEAVAIVPAVKAKIEEYRKNGDLVIFTADTHNETYLDTPEGQKLPIKHCIKGTDGWRIHPTLVKDNDFVLCKSNFGMSDVGEMLTDILRDSGNIDAELDCIEMVGLCTDICVISNALILKSTFSYPPIKVDAKCCAGTTPDKHRYALEVMKSCQIDVVNDD